MIIRVWNIKVKKPELSESPLCWPDRYYEVDRMPDREKVIQQLASNIEGLDTTSIIVEITDCDPVELRKHETVFTGYF